MILENKFLLKNKWFLLQFVFCLIFSCEQNTDEQSRDTYGKWHGQIKNMVDTIERGGIK